MNTKGKIAIGIAAGLVAGATLVGTAFAAPLVLGSAVGAPMMGVYRTAVSTGVPTVADMRRFMDTYRTPDGRIDVNRMHSDVAAGKVTPPCVTSTTGAGTSVPAPGTRRGTGYGMMGGTY